MSNWFRNRVRLYKINRQEKKLNAAGEQFVKESQKKKDPRTIDDWYASHLSLYELIEWDRKWLVSLTLLEEADQLHLPRPQYSGEPKWEEGDIRTPHAFKLVLTPEAMTELRASIRKERRERREAFEFWVKVIGGAITILTGLTGALIGLVSVLKHK